MTFILTLIILILLIIVLSICWFIKDEYDTKRRFVNVETGERIQVLYDVNVKRPNRTSTFEGIAYYSLDKFDTPFVMEINEFKSNFISLKEWKKHQKTE